MNEELLKELGEAILAQRDPGLPHSVREAIETAKGWMRANESKLRNKICGSENIRALVEENKKAETIAAIGDLIITICSGLPVATVSRLIFEYGVESYCRSEWQEAGENEEDRQG